MLIVYSRLHSHNNKLSPFDIIFDKDDYQE